MPRKEAPPVVQFIGSRRAWAIANAELIANAFDPGATDADRKEAWAALIVLKNDLYALDKGASMPTEPGAQAETRKEQLVNLALTRVGDLADLGMELAARRFGVPIEVLRNRGGGGGGQGGGGDQGGGGQGGGT